MSDAIEFVAEHIMGFERRRCQGVYGGGNTTMQGCETWFWCDWCGREIPVGTAGPCPRYPFRHFSMRDLMARLGNMGHHTMMRFDPERDRHGFTVCLDGQRVGDTDEPLEMLCKYVVEVRRLRASLEAVLDEAISDLDRDIIITECQSALSTQMEET